MSKLIILKKGELNPSQKKRLLDKGYDIIEAKEPASVIVEDLFDDLSRDVMLRCAIKALGHGNDETCRNAFSVLLRKELLKNEDE